MNFDEHITRLRIEHGICLEDTLIYKEIKTRNNRVKNIGLALLLPGLLLLTIRLPPTLPVRAKVLLISIFLIPAAYLLIQAKRVVAVLFRHPDMKRFQRWDNYPEYIKAMNAELRCMRSKEIDGVIFTENFIFQPSYIRIRWFHGSEVCWAFGHVNKQTAFYIPFKTYQVRVYLSDKKKFELASDDRLRSLRKLTAIAPFAVYGFNKELKKAWEKNSDGFIRSVEERKIRYYTDPIRSMTN